LQDGSVVLGRNFDWYDHPALILFTDPPDGYAAVSMVDISYLGYNKNDPVSADDPQLHDAPLLPIDGMNKKGLAIGIMAVPYAQLNTDPRKITLGSLQIIRLLLDYAQNLDEAISLMQEYNIDFQGGPPLHYFIVDSTGNSAVIEFVDNEYVILRTEDAWQVSTNFIISMTDFDDANSPCWRYNLAYSRLEQNQNILTGAQTMDILSAVSQSNTIWSSLYNLKHSEIQVVMGRNYNCVYNWGVGIRN
jgi:predicted choloylglycine hydrolase